jgi:hypothetical protein
MAAASLHVIVREKRTMTYSSDDRARAETPLEYRIPRSRGVLTDQTSCNHWRKQKGRMHRHPPFA